MVDRTVPGEPLAALGVQLSARRLDVELISRGLRVKNSAVAGCCDDVGSASDVISCRPRLEDGERDWFFTSWNEPIAEADRIADATVIIVGYLCEGPGR